MNPSVCSGPNCVWRFFLSCFFLLVLRASAQQITVDITPGHSTNAFSPLYAMGAGIDRDPLNSVQKIYGPTDVSKMLSAGWSAVSYRLNTELSIQAWHWNPKGNWSDPDGHGYFVGDARSPGSIRRSFGYNLPHRGVTSNYGSSGGYSKIGSEESEAVAPNRVFRARAAVPPKETLSR